MTGAAQRRLIAILLAVSVPAIAEGPVISGAPIDLSTMLETFMTSPGVKPDWAMGAGPDAPQLQWETTGVAARPDCGAFEACRSGKTRVLVNGKEMQQLRQRLEPVPWGLFMYSTGLGKFGPEAISIHPSCDAVACTFELSDELVRAGFKLKKLCDARQVGASTTAYIIEKDKESSTLVIDKDAGSGGESISFKLLFKRPADTDSLCAIKW